MITDFDERVNKGDFEEIQELCELEKLLIKEKNVKKNKTKYCRSNNKRI